MDSYNHSETLVNVCGHYVHRHFLLPMAGYGKWWQMGMLSGLYSLIYNVDQRLFAFHLLCLFAILSIDT